MSESRLIVTRADENIAEITEITHPIMRRYAYRCRADFRVIDTPWPDEACWRGNGYHHYRIMWLKDIYTHERYDRILCLDSDVLLRSDCPNLFDTVSPAKLGSVFEDKGSRQRDRQERLKAVNLAWDYAGEPHGYINTGVFMTSRGHSDIFEPYKTPHAEYWLRSGYDDVHLWFMIHKRGHEVQELSFRLNHMTMFSEGWNCHADRFSSYIIHYAGNGVFQPQRFTTRVDQIWHDVRVWYDQ